MAQKIIWSAEAFSDLDDIANFIAKDSGIYASSFIQEVLEASRSLAYLSKRGRIVPEFGNPNIREIFVGDYRLIYLVQSSEIAILGIIHGRRDLPKLWESEKRRK